MAFTQFLSCFKVALAVLFTDGDLAMEIAIAQVFFCTSHFLCTFHLAQNLFKNVHSLFPPVRRCKLTLD